MSKRVTKKQSKAVREYVDKLIREAQKALKPKYKFAYRIVGSAKYNTIIAATTPTTVTVFLFCINFFKLVAKFPILFSPFYIYCFIFNSIRDLH